MSPTKYLGQNQRDSSALPYRSKIEGAVFSDSVQEGIDPNSFRTSFHAESSSPAVAIPVFRNNEPAENHSADIVLCPRPIPVWKRTLDLFVGLLLLVLLSPLLLAIGLMIKLGSRGPVLFKQARLGYAGKEFVIYKFRTLKPSTNASQNHRQYVTQLMNSNGAAIKPDLQDRLISGGGWLRRLSLDELPQLINIIKGEMSLIGPRPDVLVWEDYEPYQLKRFEVQPGVTGLWQVSGKNRLSFNQMIEKDLEYIAKRSIRLDLLITIKTVLLLFNQDNG